MPQTSDHVTFDRLYGKAAFVCDTFRSRLIQSKHNIYLQPRESITGADQVADQGSTFQDGNILEFLRVCPVGTANNATRLHIDGQTSSIDSGLMRVAEVLLASRTYRKLITSADF